MPQCVCLSFLSSHYQIVQNLIWRTNGAKLGQQQREVCRTHWRRNIAVLNARCDSSFLPLLSCFLCPSILRGENSPKEPTWDDQCDIVSSMKAPLLPSPSLPYRGLRPCRKDESPPPPTHSVQSRVPNSLYCNIIL